MINRLGLSHEHVFRVQMLRKQTAHMKTFGEVLAAVLNINPALHTEPEILQVGRQALPPHRTAGVAPQSSHDLARALSIVHASIALGCRLTILQRDARLWRAFASPGHGRLRP